MASIAGDMGREFLSAELRRLLSDFAGGRRRGRDARGSLPAELLTARAVTNAGLTALALLPILMLASLALQAPLAGPPAIALGYLAVAHAIAVRRPRRAAALSIAVLSGFVAWTLLFFLVGGGPPTWGGLIAVSLAPLFAAAPALARRLDMPKADPGHDTTLAHIACLDRFAPSEAVLFLDGSGTLLAGTQAGLSSLGLSADAIGMDVTRRFQLLDRAILVEAIQRCQTSEAPVEMALRLGRNGCAESLVAASLASTSPQRLVMRVHQIAAKETEAVVKQPPQDSASPEVTDLSADPGCDLGEAIAFALRHAQAKARAKRIRISCDAQVGVAAAADRRVSRAILSTLLENAIDCSGPDTSMMIGARAARGAALVRISFTAEPADAALKERLRRSTDQTAVPEMVDRMGGSLLVEGESATATAGFRLALPPAPRPKRVQAEGEEDRGCG
jgi:hypothetical protein